MPRVVWYPFTMTGADAVPLTVTLTSSEKVPSQYTVFPATIAGVESLMMLLSVAMHRQCSE